MKPESLVVEAACGPELRLNSGPALSFASANYLSMELPCTCHGSQLGKRRSLGMPAWLARDRESVCLERELAKWLGTEDALLAKSAAHSLIDLMQIAAQRGDEVFVNPASYVLTRLAARTLRRVPRVLQGSQHYNGIRSGSRTRLPCPGGLVFCDGWSLRGALPPLHDVVTECERTGRWLVVDDTQALGVLGDRLSGGGNFEWGRHGTGTLGHLGIGSHRVVTVGSLAKGFGVPLAFVAGARRLLDALRNEGPLYRASSPPELPLVRAARAALVQNSASGEQLRARLRNASAAFQSAAKTVGVSGSPVQSWHFRSLGEAHAVWTRLFDAGVWALLERRGVRGGAITFLLTAAHDGPVLARALSILQPLRGLRRC